MDEKENVDPNSSSTTTAKELDISYVTTNLIAMSFPHPKEEINPKHKNKIDASFSF
jgi:hypothetical protein